MRRAQSLRTHNLRSASASSSGADDLGVLKEVGEESPEGMLARQMVAAERENDKVGLASPFIQLLRNILLL